MTGLIFRITPTIHTPGQHDLTCNTAKVTSTRGLRVLLVNRFRPKKRNNAPVIVLCLDKQG